MKFSKVLTAVTASALLISPVLASEVSPLPAGKPAGTKEAALETGGVLLVVGIAAVAVGIAAAAGAFDSKTTTTTGTGA
jgi:hypothetical protein